MHKRIVHWQPKPKTDEDDMDDKSNRRINDGIRRMAGVNVAPDYPPEWRLPDDPAKAATLLSGLRGSGDPEDAAIADELERRAKPTDMGQGPRGAAPASLRPNDAVNAFIRRQADRLTQD